MGMDSSPDTHIIEVTEPYFAGGDFVETEAPFDPGDTEPEAAADEGYYWDEIELIESGRAEPRPDAGVYGQSLEGLPAELQFGGYEAPFGEVAQAWYSSDGKVYDPSGVVLGYH